MIVENITWKVRLFRKKKKILGIGISYEKKTKKH